MGVLAPSGVVRFWIYRKGDDIEMCVIPRYEESHEVQSMQVFIISWSSKDPSYRQGDVPLRILSLVGTRGIT